MTRKILVLALLLASALATRAAEHRLTPPAFEPLMSFHSKPAIATDGASFLAAWIATPYDRPAMLMVQRLDAPAPPIAVVADPELRFGNVDLAWSNGSYLLVWNRGFELHAMRLDRDGHPISGSDHVLASDLRDPVVAAGGTAALVVARTDYVKNEVVVLTLDGDDRAVKRRSIWSYAGATYDAVPRDGGFTVSLGDIPGLFAMRFDAAGDPADPAPLRIVLAAGTTSTDYRPGSFALAARGSETLVVWAAGTFQQPGDFFAAILPAAGSLRRWAALPHPDAAVGTIDVVGDGDGYSVLFSSGTPSGVFTVVQHLQSIHFRADGTAATAPVRLTSGGSLTEVNGRIARSSIGYGVVFAENDPLDGSQRIAGFAAPSLSGGAAPAVLSRGATSQDASSIASNGAGYLVAWLERSLTRDQIRAAPLDRNGVPGAPVTLFDSHFSYTSTPKVAFGGGLFFVVWQVDAAMWGVRLDAAGRPLDAEPLRLSGELGADAAQFDVTATPGGFFTVWRRADSIYGAMLSGALPAAPQKLTEHVTTPPTAGGALESEPLVAFNGQTFLLAYTSVIVFPCAGLPCPLPATWQLLRLDSGGHPIGTAQPLGEAPLAVASDGRDFAVLQFTHLLRVDPALSVTARIDFESELRPSIVRNGSRYVVVTLDAESGGGARATARDVMPGWTFGSSRAAAIEPIVNAVAAAANAAGDVMLAYSRRLSEEPFFGAARAAVQAIGDAPPVRGRAVRHP
ncbi:MAG TPA: hypothetical protein VI670_12875 [Thermoanaerobaculia bacterium]